MPRPCIGSVMVGSVLVIHALCNHSVECGKGKFSIVESPLDPPLSKGGKNATPC